MAERASAIQTGWIVTGLVAFIGILLTWLIQINNNIGDIKDKHNTIINELKVNINHDMEMVKQAIKTSEKSIENIIKIIDSQQKNQEALVDHARRIQQLETKEVPPKWFYDDVQAIKKAMEKNSDRIQQLERDLRHQKPQTGGDSWYWGQGNRPQPPESYSIMPSHQQIE
jgi:hypothetical protein